MRLGGPITAGLVVCLSLPSAATALASPPQAPLPAAPAVRIGNDSPGEGTGMALRATSAPAFVTGLAVDVSGRTTTQAARSFLASRVATYGITDPSTQLRSLDSTTQGAVTAERFAQLHRGVPVFGGQYLVRIRQDGARKTIVGTSGSYFTGLTVGTTASVTASTATAMARLLMVRRDVRLSRVADRGLLVLPVGAGRLVRQVDVVGVRRWGGTPVSASILIDARTGSPVTAWSTIAYEDTPVTTTGRRLSTLRVPLALSKSGNLYTFKDTSREMFRTNRGMILTYDAKGGDVMSYVEELPTTTSLASVSTLPVGDKATKNGAVDAHWGAGQVYDYYRTVLGRNGLDGKGSSMASVVNVTLDGMPFLNAFWDGTKMVYGGGGGEYRPFSAGLDVVGHEMTHGVIEHSANFVYFGQSGAVNEAIADYFGNAIQNDAEGIPDNDPRAGLLGENLCTRTAPRQCALRDLNDARTTGQDYQGVVADNAGVHLNSTILSGALWDLRERQGADATDRLVYTALTQYLTPLAGFTDVRAAVLAAGKQLGYTPAKLAVVGQAFDAHGITPGWEDRLGVDSTTLMPGVNYVIFGELMAAAPVAERGIWAMADLDDAMAGHVQVYGGTVGVPASTKAISPVDGWIHDGPSTDGVTTAWGAVKTAEDNPVPTSRVWLRDLSTGTNRMVWQGPQLVVQVAVSGATVAWTTLNPESFAMELWVKRGAAAAVKLESGDMISSLQLRGDTTGYVRTVFDPEDGITSWAQVRNLRTGTVTTLAKPDPQHPQQMVGQVVLTPNSALWSIDTDGDGRTSIKRRNQLGTGPSITTVISELSPNAPHYPDFDASDQRLTYNDNRRSLDGESNETTTKLWQVPMVGTAVPQRVSCNRGEQATFAADAGSTVVWVDATTGKPALVSRPRPAGAC